MKKILFVFTGLTLLCSTCRKDSSTTEANGTVIDAGTSAPIAGAAVQIMETDDNCFTCGGTPILNATSDANGYFKFTFAHKRGRSYSVVASKNQYYSNASSGGVGIASGKINNISVRITPYAWLKIHVKNTTPFDGNDIIGVRAGAAGSATQFYGATVDTISIFTSYGNINNNIDWTVVKNSVYTNFNAKINCPAFDTTLYNINY